MPTEGKKQKSAGIKLNYGKKEPGTRKMESRNKEIKSNLRIDDVPHNGLNAVLNAQK
jgi:hypothetical protein